MDSMEIDDNIDVNKSLTMDSLISRADFQKQKRPSRHATVCLSLLCAVLLAGIIAQIIYYRIIPNSASVDPTKANSMTQGKEDLHNETDIQSTERDQLQRNHESLNEERRQLEARLSNLTESYSSLKTERDALKASFNKVKNERDQLQVSFSTLKQQSNRLESNYNDTERALQVLQLDHNNLTASKRQLQTKHNNLQREKEEGQTRFHAVVTNRDELQNNLSSLRRDKDQLQNNYNTLNTNAHLLQISYESLWKDKERLQMRYNTLTKEKEQLQTKHSSLAADRQNLQEKVDRMTIKIGGMHCPTGWTKLNTSCYFVSTTKKNWTESQKDCIAQGGDLVVIDSWDEQVFINGLLQTNQNAWIGLTDMLEEGTWTWVDKTPVNTTYWQVGQPNDFRGDQDCGEIVRKSSTVQIWNDDGCFAQQMWICEI